MRSRSYFIVSVILALFVLLIAAYWVGLARGRQTLERSLMATQTLEQVLLAATASADAVLLATPSPTATPLPTATATQTATPSPTPASRDEWAQRYADQVVRGLNGLSALEFTLERGRAILQRTAEEQGLAYAQLSYYLLSEMPWVALSIPRNGQGQTLPLLFWQDASDQNLFHSQRLNQLADFAKNESSLISGVQVGIARNDEQARLHILLVERAGLQSLLLAYVLAQPQPGADFVVDWRSSDEPKWSMLAANSRVEALEDAGGEMVGEQPNTLLPDLVIDAAVSADSPLRSLANPPATFIEQMPFAMQWMNSRWSVSPLNEPVVSGADGAAPAPVAALGYRLMSAALRSTPLTTFAQIVALAQQSDLNAALTYATRLDVVQQAFALGLDDAGAWMGLYLDAANQPLYNNQITPVLRVFDNADRQRAYDAFFELDANGFYRLAVIQPVEGFATDLVTPAAALSDAIVRAAAESTALAGEGAAANAAATSPATTASATPLPSAAPSSTDTATLTPTLAPTVTPIIVPSATPTITPTPTATATPTPPLPIPAISPEQAAPASGVLNLTNTANLRGGPGRDYLSIAPLENGTTVGVFGVTESGEWWLVRIEQAGNPYNGLIGWVFRDLVYIPQDTTGLTRYRDDGTSLTPTPPTPTPEPWTPTATATATPLQTPVIAVPEIAVLGLGNVPTPEANERLLTVAGELIPANPFAPIPVVDGGGQSFELNVEAAQVQAWGGIFAASDAGWRPASAELLWPESTIYVQAAVAADATNRLIATRVRIVAPPPHRRPDLLDVEALAAAWRSESAAMLLGSREKPGIHFLTKTGDLQLLFDDANEISWLSGDELAGLAVNSANAPNDQNSFRWLRTDGSGLLIYAQPFYHIRGVAGDAYGGIWWIETPQVNLDTWQLWHYDTATRRILLRLNASGELFGTGSEIVSESLSPILLAVQPLSEGDVSQVAIFVDTFDNATQELYTGIFRLNWRTALDDAASDKRTGELSDTPRLLLAPDDYRGPLKVSPDLTRLAYFFYDPKQPSLTSGFIRPPNQLKLLTLEGRGANTIRRIYVTESNQEFFAPNLDWQGNDSLLLARSRFAPGDAIGLDRFGVTLAQIPAPGVPPVNRSYVFSGGKQLKDFVTCRKDAALMLAIVDPAGTVELAEWQGEAELRTLLTLPQAMTRTFVCWSPPNGTP